MGDVYSEFEAELRHFAARYAGRPRREARRLLLLALEREQLVSTSYREDAIRERLEAMPIPEDARQLIRQALLWIWKDEEMHTVYVRGVLLRLGGVWLQSAVLIQQIAGWLSGWGSRVQHHLRWRQAPLSRLVAAALSLAGFLLGKVPRSVVRELHYHSFRDYCRFNVDAERTASLCFQRLTQLASEHAGVPMASIEELRRMGADEDRHAQIFELLSASLDEADQLAPGVTTDVLASKIAAVGEVFLPLALRTWGGNALGAGGRVCVLEGEGAGEKLPVFRDMLLAVELEQRLRRRAEELGKDVAELRVAVKVSFMMGYNLRDRSTNTDLELVEELALAARLAGARHVFVVEAPNLYDRFFRNRGVFDVARYFRIESSAFQLVDASAEQVPFDYPRGMAQTTVSRTWKEADFRVSFGKLRSHPVDHVHLTVANVDGLGARCDEFLFAERQAQRETATMALLDAFPIHLALLDGYDHAADGILGVIGSSRPRSPRRLYGGTDALAVDLVAARHMRAPDARDLGVLRAARHWFGDPGTRTEVVGVDAAIPSWRGPQDGELSALLSFVADPVYVLASGRGALFLPEMDERAFPPVSSQGIVLRAARRALRNLLGLRLSP